MRTLGYRLMLIALIPAFLMAMIVAGLLEAFWGTRNLFRQYWREAGGPR